MADTFTTNLNLTKPEPGAAEDTWGISLNDDLDTLDAIFSTSGTQVNLNPNQVNFADNKKAIFGTGSDLQIYHDGSHSRLVDSGTGNFIIQAAQFRVNTSNDAEAMIKADVDGAVTLYHNGTSKIATTTSGIDVTGRTTTDGLTTSASLISTSNSNSLGGTTFTSAISTVGLSSSAAITSTSNSNSLGGTSFTSNIDVTGTVTADGLTVNGDVSTTGYVDIPSYIRHAGDTNTFFGFPSNDDFRVYTNGTLRYRIESGGDISFWDDTGTTQGLFWDASTERLGIGTTSPSELLHLNGSSDTVKGLIQNNSTSTSAYATLGFQSDYSHSVNPALFLTGSNNTNYAGANSLNMYQYGNFPLGFVTNNTLKMIIQGDGNVGIGTTNPTYKLHVAGQTYLSGGIQLNSSDRVKFGNGNQYITGVNDTSLTLATGNSASVTVLDNGSVGIGTTSPSTTLHVQTINEEATLIESNSNNGTRLKVSNSDATTGRKAILDLAPANNITGAYIVAEAQEDFSTTANRTADLYFSTRHDGAFSEKFRITSDGNVGIGTDSPARTLEIISGTSSESYLRISGQSGNVADTNFAGIEFYNTDASGKGPNVAAFIEARAADSIGQAGELVFATASTGSTPEGERATERLRIDSSGNVGIGTTSPSELLHVAGTVVSDGLVVGDDRILSPDNTSLTLISGGNTTNAGANYALFGGSHASLANVHRWRNGSTEIARFDSTGKFGIGTSSPSAKLHVESANNYNGTNFESNPHLAIDNGTPTNHTAVLMFESSGTDASNKRSGITGGNYYSNKHGLGFFGDLASKDRSATPDMFINSSGNVGIGTTSPSQMLELSSNNGSGVANVLRFNDSDTAVAGGQTTGRIEFAENDGGNTTVSAFLEVDTVGTTGGGVMTFGTGSAGVTATERMRIDSSGNLLVGTTNASGSTAPDNSSDTNNAGLRLSSSLGFIGIGSNSQPTTYLNRIGSDGDIAIFRKSGTTVGSIGSSFGNRLYIGDGDTAIRFANDLNTIVPWNGSTNALRDNAIDLGEATGRFKNLYLSNQVFINGTGPNIRFTDSDTGADSQISASSGVGALVLKADYNNETAGSYMGFEVDGSERARIDSSGNVLVGTTDNNVTNNTGNTPGINIGVAGIKGYIAAARYQGAPLALNRLGNDGDIAVFTKDGATVGSIGTYSGGLVIGNGDTGLRMQDSINSIYAFNTTTGANRDDAINLGASSVRFQDIYATNGTIQTSDINEKQDIEDLSEAETRVAVAAKGLLKKYRWKSAVADKGDDARIHFGIMAQDLENAFANEGLDAGDYGMFISSTWTDEATGEEKTRLGVRYNELLAFIIAAI